MLEPQGTGLFILLMATFCALLVWVARSKQTVLRVLAASLAFIPAMLFGVAAVNKYYDYYQTWSSVAADFGGQGLSTASAITANVSSRRLRSALKEVATGTAARQGEVVRLTVTGDLSNLTRTAFVFLPPQYFQQAYRHYRFPAIELIPGFPGEPQDWINVVGITHTFVTLLNDGAAKPAVLVMPDANGSPRVSLQCLNVVHGPQDATFLAVDVPLYLSQRFRVWPSGRAWGIAGYSEGGFCAANLALLYSRRFGYSGVLSGYFRPFRDRMGNPPHMVSPFGTSLALLQENTPMDRVSALPVSAHIPSFWLGVGSGNRQDMNAAREFQRLLLPRQPDVQLRVAAGGGHTMATWRALVPPMLEWMTPALARAASHIGVHVAHKAAGGSRPPASPAPASSGAAGTIPSPRPSG